MAKESKAPKVLKYRLSLVDDDTHRLIWKLHFRRGGLYIAAISCVVGLICGAFALISLTPLKTFIPGYPDATSRMIAQQNAMTADSLKNVIYRWEFYSENLRKIVEGVDPVMIDSLVNARKAEILTAEAAGDLHKKDSILRADVMEAEQFSLGSSTRKLPIEGIHFFPPLKGVISQTYEEAIHPYVDITAPANSVVMAALDGTVVSAGWSDDTGWSIAIQHDNDIISIYRHNERLMVNTGARVSAGTPIAIVGGTGTLSTGEHLHFELWYKGEAVDPAKYINF